ncbi:MAG: dihydrolipoamide acetyltransferase family protein [Ktedonobacterales bacterium]
MTQSAQFLLPDLGEGLEEAQLVQWLVQAGDQVTLNQPLCQVETAKALVDVPSPFAGTVEKLHVEPGDTVLVGRPLVTFYGADAGGAPAESAASADGHGPVLVGYGTEGPAQSFSRRRRGVASPATPPSAPLTEVTLMTQDQGGRASPLVRKMAEERGIDLSSIKGSGPGGRIRVEDLETAASAALPETMSDQRDDAEERISTVGLRKAIAARMMKAATTIPHFTEYSLFDASALVDLRGRLRNEPEFRELKLTYLPFFVRALVEAVRAYPIMNSRWDEEGNAIVVKRSIHVGIATDTSRGLLVPVIHQAHTLGLAEIAAEANRLIALARSGKIEAKSLMNSTITITNVGAAGPVDTGAPLINPPEACVVGFGALKPRPTVVGDTVQVRPGAWISISCDHRIVDGASAAQFMGVLVQQLERPERLR